MTTDPIRAELDEALKHAKAAGAYAETAKNAAASAQSEAVATEQRIITAIDLLEDGDGGDGDGGDDEGLLYELEDELTAPLEETPLEANAVTVSLVMDIEVVNSHQKVFCIENAISIGLNPSGALDIWCYAGAGEPVFQIVQTPPAYQYRKATWVLVEFGDEAMRVQLDGKAVDTEPVAGPRVSTVGKRFALMAGYWNGQTGKDPAKGKLAHCRVFDHALTTAEQLEEASDVADLIEAEPTPPIDNGGNGNGGNGNGNGGNGNGNGGNGPVDPGPAQPIEPVDGRFHQVAIGVTDIAHEWRGAGTGLNSMDHAVAIFPRVKQHKARLDRIGIHVLRIFSPHGRAACVAAYKPYFDLFKPTVVAASGFIYRSGGPVRNNIRALAEGVKYCIDAGLRIDIVTGQNEEDGHPGNKPRDGSVVDHHHYLRQDLDGLGLHHVVVATLEHRHPPNNGIPEFDALKAAGRIGKGKAVEIGCGHVYDKTQGLALGDRMRSVGLTWSSWETGNNGSGCSSIARELSAANLGSAFATMHYIQITTGTPNSEQLGQAFIDYSGRDRPWAGHWEVGFGKVLVPKSMIYRASSSDRAPGMPVEMDQWMERNAARSAGRNPRLACVVAKRPDGRAAIVTTNTTHGSDAFSPYTTGHYARLDQQHTVTIPWLAGKNGSFQLWRASPEGAITGPQTVGMQNGQVRYKIGGGETVGAIGGLQ